MIALSGTMVTSKNAWTSLLIRDMAVRVAFSFQGNWLLPNFLLVIPFAFLKPVHCSSAPCRNSRPSANKNAGEFVVPPVEYLVFSTCSSRNGVYHTITRNFFHDIHNYKSA